MFSWLNPLKILLDPIERVTKAITDVQIAKAKAETDEEKIAADERIKALQARRDALIGQSAHSKLPALLQALLALPVVIFLWKVLVFDKVFGQWLQWRTDPLDTNLWSIVLAVVSFYFVNSMIERFR